MTSKPRYNPTEHIGVIEIERIFTIDFQWATRKILESDFGIDLEVEICDNGNPTGQLIGVQIKSGESYFKTDLAGKIVYRGNRTHLDYWLNHSLPIIIILHNPKTGQSVWEEITSDTVSMSKKGWKIEIPLTRLFDKTAKNEITNLNKYPLYFQRFQRLALHKKLIREINEGNKFVLELDEWINKTIGRIETRIKKIDNDANEIIISEGAYIFFKGIDDLAILYPWADFEIDEDYYEDYDEDDFYTQYGIWDSEKKDYVGATISFQEYLSELPEIRPIEGADGEVHYYRLVFKLNELGTSFVTINDFLENGIQLKLRY